MNGTLDPVFPDAVELPEASRLSLVENIIATLPADPEIEREQLSVAEATDWDAGQNMSTGERFLAEMGVSFAKTLRDPLRKRYNSARTARTGWLTGISRGHPVPGRLLRSASSMSGCGRASAGAVTGAASRISKPIAGSSASM